VQRFDLVGLHWRGNGEVLFRTRSLTGRWSRWQPGLAEDDGPDGPRGGVRVGSPYWTGGADAIQYRARGRVFGVRAFLIRSSGGVVVRRPQFTKTPTVITRAQWGANEAIRRGAPRYADAVHLAIVHHTAGSNAYSASQSAAIVRAIELYHVKGNGWNDIGYNFLVDKYGQVFEGRYGGMTRPVIGAHAMGFNVGSVGIAVIGDYSAATLTLAARAALVSLLAWRLDLAHVDPLSRVVRVSTGNPRYPAGRAVTLSAISGHRDTYPTSCPGSSLYAQLPAIRAAVARTGLPKIYDPAVSGALGGPVRFTARLSGSADWSVTVRDDQGVVVGTGSGTGAKVDWTWDASTAAADRQYSWAITVPQARSATGTIGTALPPLALRAVKITPSVVTPNGDGRGDRAKVMFRVTRQALVTATLVDQSQAVVATLFKRLFKPGLRTFDWKGVAVPDGRYRLTLAARDAQGKQVQALVPVAVDRTLAAFAASPVAISPNGDGRQDKLAFTFRLNAPAQAQVRILAGATLVATVFEGPLGAGPQRFSWDGSGLDDGLYTAIVSATDSVLTVKQAVPVRIDRAAPVLRLLSFRLLRFWLSEPARVTLTLDGRTRRVDVKRPGAFRVPHAPVRTLVAQAQDAAGNRSRVIRR
jgi:N-acetylmuramoyl-L-alanine amidase